MPSNFKMALQIPSPGTVAQVWVQVFLGLFIIVINVLFCKLWSFYIR